MVWRSDSRTVGRTIERSDGVGSLKGPPQAAVYVGSHTEDDGQNHLLESKIRTKNGHSVWRKI